MVSKPKDQTFVQDWNKTVEWAKANKIPYSAYYPVYQLDAQRLLSGTPMSEAARIQAIQSAYGLNVTTALPTDAPNPSDVVGNVRTNAANIFTGLEPQHLISNIWDTVANTIEHPSSLGGAVEDFAKILNPLANQQQTRNAIGAFDQHVLASHSLLSWVPGLYDAAVLTNGGKPGSAGLKQLADNPLTSILDILPLGKAVPQALADGQHGAAIASKMGVTTAELRHMDSIQFAYRALKSGVLPWDKRTMPGQGGFKHPAILSDAAGNPIGIRPMNIGERIKAYRNTANIGEDQGNLMMGTIVKSEDGTRRVFELAGPAVEALGALSKDDYTIAQRVLAADHRAESDILDDPRYPEPVRAALDKVYAYSQMRLQMKLQTGEMVAVTTQFGVEYYSVKPGSSGVVVTNKLRLSQETQARLDKVSKPLDALVVKIQMSDVKMQGAFAASEQMTAAIYGSIRQSEPQLAGISHGIGTAANDILWQKMVDTQSPLLRNLLGFPRQVTSTATRLFPQLAGAGRDLTLRDANAMRTLFEPGGLLDQRDKAYKDQDWLALTKYSKAIDDKFSNSTFRDIPKDGNQFLNKVKSINDQIHTYAVQREKDVNAMDKIMTGTKHGATIGKGKFAKNSVVALSKKAHDTHQAFLKAAIDHPPDVWRNTYLDLYVDQIMRNEKSATVVDDAARALIDRGYKESEVTKMRQDPRTIVELMVRTSKNSLENAGMPDIEVGLSKELSADAYKELSQLRAMGHKPAYIPLLSPHDIKEGVDPTYNVSIGSIRPRSVGSTFARAFDFTSSIYDVQLGILQDAKDQITKDITQEFKDEYVSKHLHDVGEVNEIAMYYIQEEIAHHTLTHLEEGVRKEAVDALVLQQVKRMGLVSYDPENIFGTISAAKLDKPYYIDGNLQSAIEKSVQKFQFPAEGFWDKGTKVFRFSILGLSPRYTAHILFGGTALIAYRGHLSMFSQLRAGWHVATTGQLPEDVLAKYPHAQEHMTHSATQEGQADQLWHRATGYQGGNWAIKQWMDDHQLAATAVNWLKAAANINFRFTRAVVRMQRAVVYLDGAARAEKTGSFTEHVLVPRINKDGSRATHPLTGKQLFDEKEQVSTMTPERAHSEGMKAVADVMGELRHMTPLERSLLTRIFPFYGWTKHVLTYVLTYPIDHPVRATFLSQLATQNSADVATGLPTRIQLLMFLGHPDAQGNVSAVDARFMDPLRDTANYASLTGFFQSLNPILSAPLTTVNPQITFGGNEIYPHVTYSQLYGVKEAGPQGNAYTAAEQFVPQLQAVDEAFNLSGQYAYLKTANPTAFQKKVFESLNVPFFQLQHINLRQIAAQNELDRFSIAQNAAYEAASTGDMSYIAGYPSTAQLPDPLNTRYNVTPAYIEAMTQRSEAATGLPFTETVTPPSNPPL